MVAMMLQSALENEGCNVISAGFLEQATLLAVGRSVDAAVLDVNLHGKLSYPVADALAARDIPFVFSTGNANIELRDRYPDRPVLAKPYQPNDLIVALLSLLAGR